jgi:protease I
MRIVIIIAQEGFRDEEFKVPFDFFITKGFDIDVASTHKGTCRGKLGMTTYANMGLDEVKVPLYDAIIFIGGPGTPTIRSNPESIRIAKESFNLDKVLGAICWSPTILAKAGILKGFNATVWEGDDPELGMTTTEYLEEQGANYVYAHVVVDGKFITGDGPLSSEEFTLAVWKVLT